MKKQIKVVSATSASQFETELNGAIAGDWIPRYDTYRMEVASSNSMSFVRFSIICEKGDS